jgi:hypothetical protein
MDIASGKVGCFLFDTDHWQKTGEFKAVSDVYPDLLSFYNGTDRADRCAMYLERIVEDN